LNLRPIFVYRYLMRFLLLLATLLLVHVLHAQFFFPRARVPRMHRHAMQVAPHVQLAPQAPWLPVRDTLYTDDTLRVMVEGEVMVVPAFDPRVPVHGFQRKVDGEWQDLQPLPHPIRKRDHYYQEHSGPSVGLVPAVGHRPASGGLWAPGEYRVVLLEGGKKPLPGPPFHVVAR
jgi:hypothetical protein